jgi:hypothetical protein
MQGFESFESCFRTLAGHNLLPYSVEDTSEVVSHLSFAAAVPCSLMPG